MDILMLINGITVFILGLFWSTDGFYNKILAWGLILLGVNNFIAFGKLI